MHQDLFEYFRVWVEGDLGTGILGFAYDLHLEIGNSSGVPLVVDLTVPSDLHIQVFREGIHHTDPHTMEASGYLVAVLVELAACVEDGHHDLKGGLAMLRVNVHRDPPAIVPDRDTVVLVDRDDDPVAVSGHGLVDAVVYHFVDEMMKAPFVGAPDVHTGSFPYCLEPFQNLDFVRTVAFICHCVSVARVH